ncbi:hypothetical protein GCM10020229_75570 [Kitasatospora albolonga]
MTTGQQTARRPRVPAEPLTEERRRGPALPLLGLAGVVLAATGVLGLAEAEVVQAWRTLLVSIVVAGMPFLLLGTVASRPGDRAFVPPSPVRRTGACRSGRPWRCRWPEWRGWCCPAASAPRCRSPAA